MTMIDAQRRVSEKALFSLKRLAEEIEYTDSENVKKIIPAIVERGVDMTRSDWNDAHTRVEHSALNDMAEFSVLKKDVPKPKEGDHIVYDGDTWKVSQIFNYDSAGGNYVLICSKNSRGWGL